MYAVGTKLADRAGMVKMIISKGADVNAKDNGGETALSMAMKNWHLKSIHLLIAAGAKGGIVIALILPVILIALLLVAIWRIFFIRK